MSRPEDWGVVPPRTADEATDQDARTATGASIARAHPDGDSAPHADGTADRSGGPTNRASGGRPAPQYGEYAPDGWVNPVVVEEQRREQEEASAQRPVVDPASGGGASGRPSTAAGPVWRFGKTPLDLLLTLVLLGMGLMSVVRALSVGAVASTVREALELQYTALADPGSLTGAATISAVGLLVLFALVVWWSVVRLRATKRTFWVPLLGGAVGTVFSTVVFLVVVFQDDHFVASMMQHATGG